MLLTNADIADPLSTRADTFVVPMRLAATPTIVSDEATSKHDKIESTSARPYGQLANWTINNIGRIEPLVAAYHSLHCCKLSGNGKFKLWAHQWRLGVLGAHVGTCRMVLIQGSTNEIINTWVFPATPSQDPVFAAELIAMAGAPRLTFIDIQTPAMQDECHAVRSQTLALREKFSKILSDETPPSWAIADSQGGYVFSRTLALDDFQSIQDCYKSYFIAYLTTLVNANSNRAKRHRIEERDSLDQLHAYQIHHMESSPGNVFLSKLFGVDWTKNFLEKFLFTLA